MGEMLRTTKIKNNKKYVTRAPGLGCLRTLRFLFKRLVASSKTWPKDARLSKTADVHDGRLSVISSSNDKSADYHLLLFLNLIRPVVSSPNFRTSKRSLRATKIIRTFIIFIILANH